MQVKLVWQLLLYNQKFDYTIYRPGFYRIFANGLRDFTIGRFYLGNINTYKYLVSLMRINLRGLHLHSAFIGFIRYRFVLFSGLGFKRRLFKRFNTMFGYVGDRHWILYKFGLLSGVSPNRRRNFIFLSGSKGALTKDYNFFSSLKKTYVYKMKGFLDTRVRGRFLFVRRIKIRGVRTKLSKKQQLL